MLIDRIATCGICSPEEMKKPVMSVPKAGEHFGLPRNSSYTQAEKNQFPVEVIHIGRRMMVSSLGVHQVLGLA